MGLGLVWETFSCEVATPIMGTRDDPLWHTTYTENILNWSNRNTALLQLGFCPNNSIDFLSVRPTWPYGPYGCYTHILNSIRKGYWEPLAVVSYRGARGYIWYRPLHKNEPLQPNNNPWVQCIPNESKSMTNKKAQKHFQNRLQQKIDSCLIGRGPRVEPVVTIAFLLVRYIQ